MLRLICKLIDAWHDPLEAVGLQRERHQGSPVNYHRRQREKAAVRATPASVIRTLDEEPQGSQEPDPEPWIDPPLFDEGVVLDECPDCDDGFDHTDELNLRLCGTCGGWAYRPHEHRGGH